MLRSCFQSSIEGALRRKRVSAVGVGSGLLKKRTGTTPRGYLPVGFLHPPRAQRPFSRVTKLHLPDLGIFPTRPVQIAEDIHAQ